MLILIKVRDVKAIGCGGYHTLVLLGGHAGDDDQLLSCGLNNYGQV